MTRAQIAEATRHAMLRPVVNATGVLLHTNLGRAPLGFTQPADYTNLELSLATGKRGSRRDHAGALLARACGAEAALVVNNGAAAVLLALAALARGGGVAVSRGELVEIGGGFRIPEVMEESGARLVEVGTTNRTRVADYERVAGDVELILKVHQSNYRITGFTEDAAVEPLAALGPPVVVDLGSGLLDAACPWLPDGPPPWLRDEPAVRQTHRGGRRARRLLGRQAPRRSAGRHPRRAAPISIDTCARHPLYRALRPGGLVLAALQQVALAYLGRDGDALAVLADGDRRGRRSSVAVPWRSARERCRVRVGDRWRHGARRRDPFRRRRGRRRRDRHVARRPSRSRSSPGSRTTARCSISARSTRPTTISSPTR